MRKLFSYLNLLALLVFSSQTLKAQMPSTAAGYAFTTYNAAYNQLSGGTTIAISSDDKTVSGIPIGFTFPFTTGNYTTVSVSSNGWLSFNTTTSSGLTNSATDANTFGPMVAPLWDDLSGSPSGVASYQTSGAAPNRVFTVEWRSWRWNYGSGNNVIAFQVRLFETGRIEITYNQGPDAPNSPSATIGIAKSGSDYQTLNAPTASPTSSSSTFTTTISTKPPTGQVYIWDRPCNAPGSLSAANITNSGANISWGAIPASLGYEYIISTSATPPAYTASGANTTTSANVNLSGLASGTTYYIYVRNKCSTNFSAWTALSFSTLGCFNPSMLLIKYVSDTSASMLWSPMVSSDYYQYALTFDKTFPPAGIVNTTNINQTFNGLTPNSKYYFFLRSRCFGTDSSGWRVDSFVTLINCYPPVVKVNALGTNEPYAYWDPVPTAFAYEYAVTTSQTPPAFGSPLYTTFVGLTLPADGNNYYLHVRTQCNTMSTRSGWSTTTLREGITNVPVVSGKEIKVYPNPVKDVLFVDGLDHGQYRIMDVAGREITSGNIEQRKATISTASLPAGVYMLQVEANGARHTQRFTKE
ncbi:T9SS type A sorting domain-containing protein [Polluticoccus soli]|uniref:T9SS type A sorting domain-containing protein n=1 Tax=Polluticoccus soli TaxID=3034150 RepID=UPI0023E2FC18|nr:T9SS type A sorting domain-containing protein [Flavipsychrobacter sp. JY13-12]